MKKTFFFLLLLDTTLCMAQNVKPVKVSRTDNHFIYEVYNYGERIDTQYVQIEIGGFDQYLIADGQSLPGEYQPAANAKGNYIPGYSVDDIFVDEDSIITITTIFDNDRSQCYRTATPFGRTDIKFDTAQVNGLTRYTCSINSNKMEFYVQPFKTWWNRNNSRGGVAPRDITPLPHYGRFPGLLVSFWRNGQCQMQLAKTEKMHSSKFYPSSNAIPVTWRQLSDIKRNHMVITTRVFDSVQLCWCGKNDHIEGNYRENTPFDSVLHYAGGTLALKRVRLPQLPLHYQTFLELRQRSNGDAYDRTGSVFVIPEAYVDLKPNFFDGINSHPDSLPCFIGRDGERYQGFLLGISRQHQYYLSSFIYEPPVELMRFFTPFGVGQFNDRVQIDGLDWEDEAYYKQEVTDLAQLLQGEVWIGIWIGNYDKGGHTVTLDIKSYPGDSDPTLPEPSNSQPRPLFNTCNVLEMAGQNYGKLFGTDSIKVSFSIYDTNAQYRLRYIATGHGGWDGGDEFNPKTHTILIDGQPVFTHTPWRSDCGRYREWNPVSGNFWNGMSSSDFSRSGWCPGTATQPVYFTLPKLSRGNHTLTVAIPQGKPQAGSFSHWCVSGVLLQQ